MCVAERVLLNVVTECVVAKCVVAKYVVAKYMVAEYVLLSMWLPGVLLNLCCCIRWLPY